MWKIENLEFERAWHGEKRAHQQEGTERDEGGKRSTQRIWPTLFQALRKGNIHSIESYLNFMAKTTKSFPKTNNNKKSVLFCLLLTRFTIVGSKRKVSQGPRVPPTFLSFFQIHPAARNYKPGANLSEVLAASFSGQVRHYRKDAWSR